VHWLWQPAPQYSGVLPQNPNWLQQRQLAHFAPPPCEPHLWSQPLHWLWQPAPQCSGVLPQNPNLLQQRQFAHVAPPACEPQFCARAAVASAAARTTRMAFAAVARLG
jgi:hypothetical protein